MFSVAISYSQFVLQFLTLLQLLCVYVINIARHIKITSVLLNFEFEKYNGKFLIDIYQYFMNCVKSL